MKDKLITFGDLEENVDLKKYNTYGIGGKTKYLLKVFDIPHFINLINFLKTEKVPFYILGSGSNVILPDNDFEGVIIRLDYLNKISFKSDTVEVEAGALLSTVTKEAMKNGYVNLGFAYHIPGVIGAAIIGNVGAFGHEIFDYVREVTILEDREIKTLKKADIKYGYRYTELKEKKIIVLKANLALEKGDVDRAMAEIKINYQKRKNTQPIGTKNAGSVFKNPLGYAAGKLIEEAGLKNKRVGGAVVSNIHANFIVNDNFAKSSDIIELIQIIKEEIKKKNNIDLELEQVIVNWG